MVVRAVPFHLILDAVTKLVPVTVRVKAALPACTLFCDRLLSVGTGLLMVSPAELESLPPAPLITDMDTEPPFDRSLAGTVAVTWELLT